MSCPAAESPYASPNRRPSGSLWCDELGGESSSSAFAGFREEAARNPDSKRDFGFEGLNAGDSLSSASLSWARPEVDGLGVASRWLVDWCSEGDDGSSSLVVLDPLDDLTLMPLWPDRSSSCANGSDFTLALAALKGVRTSLRSDAFRSKYLSRSLMVPKRTGELGGRLLSPEDSCCCSCSVVVVSTSPRIAPPFMLSLPRLRPGLRGGAGMRLLSVFRAEAVVVARCLAGRGAVRGGFVVVEAAALPRCRYRLLSGLSLIDSRVGSHVEDDDAAEERAWPRSTMVAVMADMDEDWLIARRLLACCCCCCCLLGNYFTWYETARPGDALRLGVCAPASNRSFLPHSSACL
jgi:hypothetical protein